MKKSSVFLLACAMAAGSSLVAQSSSPAVPKAPAKAAVKLPRAADGHPDLQGIWTNVTLTQLERPEELKGKATLTDAEAKAYEQRDLKENSIDNGTENKTLKNAGSAGTGAYNDLFIDRGSELARVDGVKRTSLITDPPDGKVPPITPEARQRFAGLMRMGGVDDVKHRPLSERCIIGFGSTAGPPMLPVLYNNNYQIVQTADTVMILVEMVHDVRVIRINGTHPSSNLRFLLGDSIGHWEGDTLVVETTNFSPEVRFRGSSENLKVTERFRLVSPRQILYRATIEDPTTFTKPWTIEYPFNSTAGPIYEYACHEGNYAETDILSGARKTEAEEKK
jgi:hypothetical protein